MSAALASIVVIVAAVPTRDVITPTLINAFVIMPICDLRLVIAKLVARPTLIYAFGATKLDPTDTDPLTVAVPDT